MLWRADRIGEDVLSQQVCARWIVLKPTLDNARPRMHYLTARLLAFGTGYDVPRFVVLEPGDGLSPELVAIRLDPRDIDDTASHR